MKCLIDYLFKSYKKSISLCKRTVECKAKFSLKNNIFHQYQNAENYERNFKKIFNTHDIVW